METLLKELEKKWPSKKVLRAEIEKIKNQLSNRNENYDEFDHEVKYFMKVSEESNQRDNWEEEIENAHRFLPESSLIEECKSRLNHFNKTLREGEKPRVLLGVIRKTTLKEEVKIWQETSKQ